MDVLAHALSALQAGAMYRLDAAFKTMANVNWASNTMVGEESPYVHQWHSTLQTLLGNVRDSLSDTYFRNFCTKLAAAILQRYVWVRSLCLYFSQNLIIIVYFGSQIFGHYHCPYRSNLEVNRNS